ncbi:M81 family metallopeptidase [Pseudonocardia xinjiangensis]|uniref:M81 family metallopeptidase n=1 Tax=Pseudonocardia xinjiangensis TaxID=75289 RepID=A0ABX1RB63_9PSEU|nr:M81 family metallopeptidase [Pseudonocardia xinjiangensis]NMH76355.1 M81 family metallopeptidase [Pseudonocardia xinjiangensis]
MTDRKLRIAIAGIAIESSTFCLHRTTLEEFHVVRGKELLDRYDFLRRPDVPEHAWARDVEWVPLVHAAAMPGGPVLPDAYDTLEAETLERLGAAGPLDGVFLDIHGAMTVQGRRDAEARLTREVRAVVGPDVLLSASMDLHGNVSRELATAVDLITCYRMAPHEDAWESRARAARNLVSRLRAGGRPKKAWVQVPVLLPGERTSTRVDPAKSIYARVPQVEAQAGVLDAAVWVGYVWADEPRNRAAVVVSGDDEETLLAGARELARSYWDARADFGLAAPSAPLAECVRAALASPQRPFYISDSGDNPTAGGAGDASYALRELLADGDLAASGATVIYASIADADSARAAAAAGVGATVSLSVGGKIDTASAPPAELTGTVTAVVPDDPRGGVLAVVAAGAISVIITERRRPFHDEVDFTRLGLDPRHGADLVVVKIGYLQPELFEMSAGWMLALTPGGVDQDLLRLGHHDLDGPVYPFQPLMDPPALEPELIP